MDDTFEGLIERLPQGPAFRFVERVVAHEPGRSAAALSTFPPGHRVFEGHLPDEPIVPGVILLEALAQLSGVALVEPGDATPLRGFLAGVSRVRFLRKVGPGETIRLESTLDRRLGTAAQFQVAAFVGEEPVAKGTITVGGLGA